MRIATVWVYIFLLYALPGFAEVFYYKDDQGTLHGVDSPTLIPEKFRKGMKQFRSRETQSREVQLKLEQQGNSMLIPVTINGVSAKLVLDTGANITMISRDLAKRLALKQTHQATINTASGTIQVPVVVLPEISVQHLTVKQMPSTVNDLPNPGKAEGLLGVDFLNHFRIQLDTQTGIIRMEKK